MLLFSAFLLLTKGLMTQADVKTWAKDTNFKNPRNWPSGRELCRNDKIIFPKDEKIVTLITGASSFAEIILPLNGELTFQEDSILTITGHVSDDTCVGGDVHFVVNNDYWHDPHNWNITSLLMYPLTAAPCINEAVPHAFRIPCETDSVIFPKNTSFRTNFDITEISVKSMEINGYLYNNQELEELLETRIGGLLFPDKPHITITQEVCLDPSGCVCGNDKKRIIDIICHRVICPRPLCDDEVMPHGNCCPICGAYLIMERGMDFKINNLVQFYNSYFKKAEYQNILSYTAKLYNGTIETVFLDGGDEKGRASQLAQELYDVLSEDTRSSNTNSLRSVKVYKSERWVAGVPTAAPLTKGGMSPGGVAAIVIIVLLVSGISAAWFLYKRYHVSGFSFARFEFHSSKVELELGTTPHDELSPEASASSKIDKAFDNPMYGEDSTKVDTPAVEDEEDDGIVENPMFMVFESEK